MIRRCEARHGKGNCQKKGAMYYPKCRPGYNPFGCCICRPEKPNCKGLGMGGQIDLSCAKNIIIGRPHTAGCPPGTQYDAGLCYPSCKRIIMVLDLYAGLAHLVVGLAAVWELPNPKSFALKLFSVKFLLLGKWP